MSGKIKLLLAFLALGALVSVSYLLSTFSKTPSDPATAASKIGPEPARSLSATVFPNPFNPTTTIRFSLPTAMAVSAEVWSVSGARVRVLADGRTFAAGANALAWDGTDERGMPLGSGVYFVRLRTRVGDSVTRAVLFK